VRWPDQVAELIGNVGLGPVAGAAVALERSPVHHAASRSGTVPEMVPRPGPLGTRQIDCLARLPFFRCGPVAKVVARSRATADKGTVGARLPPSNGGDAKARRPHRAPAVRPTGPPARPTCEGGEDHPCPRMAGPARTAAGGPVLLGLQPADRVTLLRARLRSAAAIAHAVADEPLLRLAHGYRAD